MEIKNIKNNIKNGSVVAAKETKEFIDDMTPSMAIIVAGILVSLSIFLTVYTFFGGKNIQIQIRQNTPVINQNNQIRPNINQTNNPAMMQNARQSSSTTTPIVQAYPPINPIDHTTGNLTSKISLIQYSDLTSQSSNNLYTNLDKIYTEYSKNNDVVWAFRHLISNASSSLASEATECANEIGGKGKFWSFVDKAFSNTGLGKNLDKASLTKIATSLSLDQKKFQTCLDSGKYKANVDRSTNEARMAGVRSNPTAVLAYKSKDGQNKFMTIDSSAKYENIKSIITNILTQIK